MDKDILVSQSDINRSGAGISPSQSNGFGSTKANKSSAASNFGPALPGSACNQGAIADHIWLRDQIASIDRDTAFGAQVFDRHKQSGESFGVGTIQSIYRSSPAAFFEHPSLYRTSPPASCQQPSSHAEEIFVRAPRAITKSQSSDRKSPPFITEDFKLSSHKLRAIIKAGEPANLAIVQRVLEKLQSRAASNRNQPVVGILKELRSSVLQIWLRKTVPDKAVPVDPDLPEHRTRYVVKAGETLETVAKEKLGDTRFATLLITINRGSLQFVTPKSEPMIREGQIMFLPSLTELKIHRKHFLQITRAKTERQNSLPPASVLREREDEMSFNPTSIKKQQHLEGEQQSSNFPFRAADAYRRRHHQVAPAETLQSIAAKDELMLDVKMWILIAKLNRLSTALDVVGKPVAKLTPGQFLLMPDADEIEQFKLIKKLLQIAELTGKKDDDLQLRCERLASPIERGKTFMHKISNVCRVNLFDSQSTFSIKLEIRSSSRWEIVASYEYSDGKVTRHVFDANGSRNSLDIDLPAEISLEMAKRDFATNWNSYYDSFKRSEAKLFIATAEKMSASSRPNARTSIVTPH